MIKRHTPRLSITLPVQLIEEIGKYQKRFGMHRSEIIRRALWEWLAKQAPLEPSAKDGPLLVAGQIFDPNKLPRDYFWQGISVEEIDQTVAEFEAAEKRYYTEEQHESKRA